MDARQELIEKTRQVAEMLGTRTITRSVFIRETGISGNQIYQHFDGWRELCQMAGLEPHMQNVRLQDDAIFSAMRDAFVELGGITTRKKFNRAFRYSADVFRKRGMDWTNAKIAFHRWCERNDPEFPFLSDLPEQQRPASAEEAKNAGGGIEPVSPPAWEPTTGKVYGEFLNFRGLQHAPVNEQGVVFLFGMIARELGFAVESVQTGYPDCEAKRRVERNRWERVRIEFEYKSRSFRDHGHDPSGCDLVVCWEHNYPECPVEVVELREEIRRLPSK